MNVSHRYNIASQVVLAHVAVVSHGMLELFKRIFVLLAASALLGDVEWRWHNAAGAALASLGTALYFGAMASHHTTSHNKGGGNTAADVNSQTKRHGSRGGMAHGMGIGSSSSGRRLQFAYILMTVVLVVSPIEFLGDGFGIVKPVLSTSLRASIPYGNSASSSDDRDSHGPFKAQVSVLSYETLEMLSMDVDPPKADLYLPGGSQLPVLVGGIRNLHGMLPFHHNLPRSSVLSSACSSVSERRKIPGRQGGDNGPVKAGRRRNIAEGRTLSSEPSSSPVQDRGLAGVYTGWLDKDNMGDDIVADIFLDMLTAAVVKATDGRTCVTLERLSPGLAASGIPGGCELEESSGCDFGVLGGGSLGKGERLSGGEWVTRWDGGVI